MLFDKKRLVDSILKSSREEDGSQTGPTLMKNEVVKTESGEIDGRHVAAEDMLSAFHERSPQRLMDAMGNFLDLHMSRPPSALSEEE